MISMLLWLVIIGVGLYLLNTLVTMAQPIKIIINAIVVILVLLWVAESFGLVGPYPLHGPVVAAPAHVAGPCAPCR